MGRFDLASALTLDCHAGLCFYGSPPNGYSTVQRPAPQIRIGRTNFSKIEHSAANLLQFNHFQFERRQQFCV